MKRLSVLIIFICFIFMTAGCGGKQSSKKLTDIGVNEDNKLLQYFKETHKDKVVLKAAEGDVNGDGKKDLIIIFNEDKNNNKMVVIVNGDKEYKCSNEVPAPISNQKIEFKDIDNKAPMEIIVSGAKGTKIGYAIFRLENMNLVDLFGEGMKDCC